MVLFRSSESFQFNGHIKYVTLTGRRMSGLKWGITSYTPFWELHPRDRRRFATPSMRMPIRRPDSRREATAIAGVHARGLPRRCATPLLGCLSFNVSSVHGFSIFALKAFEKGQKYFPVLVHAVLVL